jgi:glycerol-3-phosphate dehydrogenase
MGLHVVGADPDSNGDHLRNRYGTLATEVEALVAANPALGERLTPSLPYLKAEVVHAARAEMARSVDDVLSRRMRARLLDRDAAIGAAPEVGRLLAGELDWDEDETARQVAAFVAACRHEVDALAELEPADRFPGPMTPIARPTSGRTS